MLRVAREVAVFGKRACLRREALDQRFDGSSENAPMINRHQGNPCDI